MLELEPFEGAVVGCFGRPEALDALANGAALPVRTAPTELLLLRDERGPGEVEEHLRALDPGALALALTGGYAIWRVSGDERFEAFARLSAIPLSEPGTVVQGLVAHVPAKVVVRHDDLLVAVPSVVSHHLHARMLAVLR